MVVSGVSERGAPLILLPSNHANRREYIGTISAGGQLRLEPDAVLSFFGWFFESHSRGSRHSGAYYSSILHSEDRRSGCLGSGP